MINRQINNKTESYNLREEKRKNEWIEDIEHRMQVRKKMMGILTTYIISCRREKAFIKARGGFVFICICQKDLGVGGRGSGGKVDGGWERGGVERREGGRERGDVRGGWEGEKERKGVREERREGRRRGGERGGSGKGGAGKRELGGREMKRGRKGEIPSSLAK